MAFSTITGRVALAGAALALAVTGGLGAVSYRLAEDQLHRVAADKLQGRASVVAARLEQGLRGVSDSLAETSRNTLFANALADSAGRDVYLLPFLKDFHRVASIPVRVSLADFRGRVIAANQVPFPAPLDEGWLGAVVKAGKPDVRLANLGDDLAIALAAPIVYPNSGLPEGALTYQVSLRSLAHSIRIEGHVAVAAREPATGLAAMVPLGAAPEGPLTTETAVIAVPPLFGGREFRVEVGEAQADLERTLADLRLRYLAVAGAGTVVIVLLNLLLARRLLRRLRDLEAVARDVVATGSLERRFPVAGGDEVASLGKAFNHMLDRLAGAYHALERESRREVTRHAQRYRRLLATTVEGYLLVDPSVPIVLEANDAFCRYLGSHREALEGAPPPAFVEPLLARAREAEGKSSWVEEIRLDREDGAILWLRANATLTVEADGNRQLFLFLDDVTERRAIEQELARSNADLQQFAYFASHDLQEPLRTITNYLQLLQRRYQGKLDSDADEFIGFVVGGAKRMSALIRDLLAYSRVGRGGKPQDVVDMGAVLVTGLTNLRLTIEDAGASIEAGDLPVVVGDEAQLVSLLQNLIGNAIKYRLPNVAPRIEVAARRKGPDWLFSIRDNGIGIAENQLERVFGIFQRLHTREEYEGTGIGLAVCKRIVEFHRGRIWAESREGEGSTFFFTLPVARTGADPS